MTITARKSRARSGTSILVLAFTAALVSACSGDESDTPERNASGNGGTGGTAPGEMSMGGSGNDDPNSGGTGSGDAGSGGTGSGVQTMTPSGDAPPSLEELAEEPATVAPWTILVYGHADHTLSNSLLIDMREMVTADLGSAVQLVVLADWDATQIVAGTDPALLFPDGLQLYRIVGGGADFQLLAQAPEANLDDPLELAVIVRDVFAALPSERRGLVLWDHGGAWEFGFGGDTQNGTASASAMSAQLVAEAIRAGFEAAGITEAPPLDFLAFDTCLMSGAEVAFPFRDLAGVYIADAEIDYGNGWDYGATLSHFAQNPMASMVDLAAAEVTHWDAHHANASVNDFLLRSHAALDLSQVDAFAEATSALTQAVIDSTTFDPLELGQSAFFAVAPYFSQFEQGSSQPGLRDVGQLLAALGTTESDPAVAQAAVAARQALEELVIANSQGSLRAGAQAGVHVEQSLGSLLTVERMTAYRTLSSEWVAASRWDELLDTASAAADDTLPVFDHAVVNGEAASRVAPPVLQFTTADASVAKASVYVAVETPSSTVQLWGLVGTGLVETNTVHEFPWAGTVIGFADGQPGMLDVWLEVAAGDDPVLTIPGLLGGVSVEPQVANLVFGGSESVASTVVVSDGGLSNTMSTYEIATLFPGATFTPIYLEYGTAPEPALVPGNPISIPAEGLPLFQLYVPAGNYVMMTSLTDIWGSVGSDFDLLTLTEPLGP